MEGKISLRMALAASAVALAAAPALAQSPAEFYKGKTVQFSVGYSPGGGFDAYTRAAARFMGKHIPGNPNVIVTNMPGASSLTFVRHMQKIAPRDGTQFGMFNRGLIPKSVLEPKEVGVDFSAFTWIGSMNSELVVCYTWGGRGLKSLADVRKAKITLGETSRNSGGYIYTSILRAMNPDNIRPVMGYTTTADIWLAMERGEIDGNCTVLTSIQAQRPEWWSKRMIDIHLQFAETKHKDLPNVPTIFELVESPVERQAINFLIASEAIGRPVIAPPGIPADRTAALRKAFVDTMNDPEFLAFAKKANMDIDVVTGEQATKIVEAIKNTPREAVERARKLME
jgi:tripartite-type tricarboxylate transporter receptor subunit TctC